LKDQFDDVSVYAFNKKATVSLQLLNQKHFEVRKMRRVVTRVINTTKKSVPAW